MLYTALIIGLAGNFHCLGMCGPIAMALPVAGAARQRALAGRLLYNAGRICTYAMLGLIAGLFGQSLALTSTQQHLSLGVGILMILFIALPAAYTRKFNIGKPLAGFTGLIKSRFISLFQKRSYSTLFVAGLLNGLLPCGLVYAALAGAIATGYSWQGMAYMAVFGIGTLPFMVGISVAGQYISLPWRKKLTRITPVFTLMLAVLLILRGLNLGIPMLSPEVVNTGAEVHMECCTKK
jgi:uncharacterized protein